MEIRLQKWGNSDGIRIPSIFLKSLNLKTNDKVIIEQVDDKIIISKSNNSPQSSQNVGGRLNISLKFDSISIFADI